MEARKNQTKKHKQLMKKKELTAQFNRYHANIPASNELDDLLAAINRKELDTHGLKDELYIYIRVVILDIKHLKHPETEFAERLIEKERLCKKGKIPFHRSDGVGKKIYTDETPEEAAVRCLEEKIGFVGSIDRLKPRAVHDKTKEISLASFDKRIAGLRIITHKHRFEVFIPDELYDPTGYKIKRRRKDGEEVTSVFQWIPISTGKKPKHFGH